MRFGTVSALIEGIEAGKESLWIFRALLILYMYRQ